jgi:hypothetical protein
MVSFDSRCAAFSLFLHGFALFKLSHVHPRDRFHSRISSIETKSPTPTCLTTTSLSPLLFLSSLPESPSSALLFSTVDETFHEAFARLADCVGNARVGSCSAGTG